jgi:hypothetical protein
MTQLSRERLEYYANNEPPFGYTGSDIQEMARRLLAAEAQEPVAFMAKYKSGAVHGTCDLDDTVKMEWLKRGMTLTPLYAAPQPVAVPDDATPENVQILASTYAPRGITYQWDSDECNAAADSWNACRAAMLNAEPVSQPYTLPHWIPCSERMPEADGNYWGWWSESRRQGPVWFIKSELQAQFQSSEITHWMPLPAAPQEPTK